MQKLDVQTLEVIFNNIYECAILGRPSKEELKNDFILGIKKFIKENKTAIELVVNKSSGREG